MDLPASAPFTSPPLTSPLLMCVCLPVTDAAFRAEVEAVVDAVGPSAHLRSDGLVTVLTKLQPRHPAVAVEPVVLAGGEKSARQIWWYVHRDGRAPVIM